MRLLLFFEGRKVMRDLTKYMAKPNKTIAEHTNDLLVALQVLEAYGYIKDRAVVEMVKKACILHDVGKINNDFQIRVNAKKKIKFNPLKEVPHNVLSACLIDKDAFVDEQEYLKVLYAVLYHHDYVTVDMYLQEKEILIKETLSQIGEGHMLRNRLLRKLSKVNEDKDAIWVKGLLHKCDYSASAGIKCEYIADFLEDGLAQFIKNKQDENPNKNIEWNEMQTYCRNNQDKNLIIIAQTGMGKTEGALHWIGNHKGFFVLPLRTAINAIYDRVKKEIVGDNAVQERLAILHSDSLAYYNKTMNQEEKEMIDILSYETVAKQWALPLNITTMDQLFDFVFRYQGYELKLVTLAYSKIVVDEIQMYDPKLLAYLIYGLEQIHHIGGSIAILTATLPPFVQELLNKKIDFGGTQSFYDRNMERHNLRVRENKINAEDICKAYLRKKEIGGSNKIIVICNTVKQARGMYEDICEILEDEPIQLLHSRFIRNDRAKLEEEILEFGRTYDEQGNRDVQEGIWVATSLVEASLDIDFDVLFTELQDLSSLFQRLGRCNRKGIKGVDEINCYVYTEIDQGLLIHGTKGFIDERLYSLSKDAIKHQEGVLSEEDKMQLIAQTLTTENMQRSNYLTTFEKTYQELESLLLYSIDKKEVHIREIAAQDIIPSPVYLEHKDEIDVLEMNLATQGLATTERLKLEEKLMGYSVSVPSYEIERYKTAVIRNKAECFGTVKAGAYRQIKVIDCDYDQRGFVPKTYQEVLLGEGEFL